MERNPCGMRRAKRVLVICALLAGMLSGCQSSSQYPARAGGGARSVPERLTLSAGDEVEVRFYYTPELNVTQSVRPDGKISLELIAEVEAQGKTTAELRAELLELYRPHLKDPEVTVVARSLYNRRVYVGGQVMSPGIVEIPGHATVLAAIMEAGGFNMQEAAVQDVIVIRHEGGRRYGYSVDLRPALEGRETEPFYLQPTDIIHVPRTQIAKIGQWIDQHVNKIVPRTGFFMSRSMGSTTVGLDTSTRR